MADGGKTSVTRNANRASYTLSGGSAASGDGEAAGDAVLRAGGGLGEEQGRGSTVRPRSKSPTKRPTSPPDIVPSRSRAARSPPVVNGNRRSSHGTDAVAVSGILASASNPTSPRNSLHAPSVGPSGHFSKSVPPTPRVHARRYSNEQQRTPSPIRGVVQADGSISPRSVRSESDSRARTSDRNLASMSCRFETGLAASRRRIPYSLGGDMLEKANDTVKGALSQEEEQQLTQEMEALYKDKLLPTPESEDRRSRFKAKLETILNGKWPGNDIKVHVFGSSGNLLCTSESDVDICITSPPKVIGRMCNLAQLLASKGMERVVCIPQAKVPIVKIWDPEFELACDMNVNNTAAIENTRMVRTYVMIDPRVRPLAMVVKHWTRRRILNDAALGGTLSSYTWISLLIHFLQSRKPPVLPSLQQRPHQCTMHDDGKPSSFADDVSSLSSYGTENKETVGELLFAFFRYYAHEFDYENKVISIRAGKLLSKTDKRWHLSVNNRLCVEEPFNTDRNLGNTADDISFRGLHLELRRAFDLLCEAKLEECCAQYEFPPEQERFWQKPAPTPLPILRSRSQTNRSSRSSEGGGGRNNTKGRHSKNGPGGRRASSAAASNKNSNPYFPNSVHQSQWSVDGGQMSGQQLHEQLSQRMSMLQQQEAYYKLQQQHNMVIAQTHAHSVVQMPQLQTGRHAPNLREGPRRSSAIETGPLSAPLRNIHSMYAFPFPHTPRSGSTTPATPHAKHTATNPSSPSIGAGRFTALDPRRHPLRPMTPESSDMARSRSQPPVSSKDGTTPSMDHPFTRFVYATGSGGSLVGYPVLQQYQQHFFKEKERHSRNPYSQSQPYNHDRQDQSRSRPGALRFDGHEGEDRGREITQSEYVGYLVDPLVSAQHLAALQAQAHAQAQFQVQNPHTLPIEQRPSRLFAPGMLRLRSQGRERSPRSPSPSPSDFGRNRSHSTQSNVLTGKSGLHPRQSESLPTSLSNTSTANGPIIIDGSEDSPSDTQPASSSRPNSIYDSASSDVTATENEHRSEQGNPDLFGLSPGENYAGRFLNGENQGPSIPSSTYLVPTGQMHFGELPMSSNQVPYPSRDHFARRERLTNHPEHPSFSRQQVSAGHGRGEESAQRSVSNAWLQSAHEVRDEPLKANGLVSGLGIDVGSALSSSARTGESEEKTYDETPKDIRSDALQEQDDDQGAFHQQLPQGMVNGTVAKAGFANVLKSTPLLSPVREVRTPSPTTSRSGMGLQDPTNGPGDAKAKALRDGRRSSQHVRAASLLSGEALMSRDDGATALSTFNDEGEVADSDRAGQNAPGKPPSGPQGSEHSAQSQTVGSSMPLSYSAMARKSSQNYDEHHQQQQQQQQQRQIKGRSIGNRDESSSISPRAQSPSHTASSHAAGQSNVTTTVPPDTVVSATKLATMRYERPDVHSRNEVSNVSLTKPALPMRSPDITPQQRQQRAQEVRALAEDVARIDLSRHAIGGGMRTHPTQRQMSISQTSTTSALGQQRSPTNGLSVHEPSSPQIGSSGSASNVVPSGWQQATKRRSKKNGRNISPRADPGHRRQNNSIGGVLLPSEVVGRKGG